MANISKTVKSKKTTSNVKKPSTKNLLTGRASLINRNFKSPNAKASGVSRTSNISSTKSTLASLAKSSNSKNTSNDHKPQSSVDKSHDNAKTTISKVASAGNVKVNLDQKTVQLVLMKIAPASAAKIGFFISIAFGIVLIVAGILFWLLLDKSGIIVQLAGTFAQSGSGSPISTDSFSLDKVIIICLLLACINSALLTLLSVVIALIYNTASSLAGGLKLFFTKG